MRPTKGESIDAHEGGGPTCSSVEVSVMEMERRGWIIRFCSFGQPEMGGAHFFQRRLEAERFQEYGWQEPYESRGSRTVLRGTGGEIPPVYPTI